MFTIIGGDGKEYGPVTADQIRGWLKGGRANLDTQAKPLGADEWRRLGDYAEFSSPDGAPPVLGAAPAALPTDGTKPAERGLRLGSWFIDQVLGAITVLPGVLVLGVAFFRAIMKGDAQAALEDLEPATMLLGAGLLLGGLLLLLGIQLWLLTTRGQTVGKKICGIRIARLTDGGNPGFVTAVLMRAFLPGLIGAIPWFGLIFTVVDCCFIFRDDRRCLHDLMAGTKVVVV